MSPSSDTNVALRCRIQHLEVALKNILRHTLAVHRNADMAPREDPVKPWREAIGGIRLQAEEALEGSRG